MSASFLQGFLGTQQAGIEARNDVTVAVRNWFANRNPLVTRLPYVPVERVDFLMYTPPVPERGRPRSASAISRQHDDRPDPGRRHVPDEPRRAGARRQHDRATSSGSRSTATRPAPTRSPSSAAVVAARSATTSRRQRLDGQPDRQQPDRLRGQPDRPDHDRRRRARSIARPSSSRCRSAARPRPLGPR